MQQHRIFFALWPDDATRAALTRLQSCLGGSIIRPDKLHLTLAFLGQQEAAALPELCRILDSVPARPMTLALDTYGYFSAARIAWAGPQSVPPALSALRTALMTRLMQQQLLPESAGQFTPHVTLARHAAAPPAAPFEPLRWLASEMVLVASSVATGSYRIVASRRLA